MEESVLGKHGTDSITGFEGTITALCEYLHGEDQFCITALVEGKPSHQWFNVKQVSIF